MRGESDPRLMGDYGANTDSNGAGLVTTEIDTDSQSATNSDAIWENDVSENLLEVDFPSNEVAANALATPTNNRYYHSSTDTFETTHRQEKYLQRLESPPAEVFGQRIDDPFASLPIIKDDSPNKPVETEASQADLSSATANSTLDEARIRKFIRLHRAQIKEMEEWIRNEKKMIGKLSLTVTSESDFQGDIMDNQQIKEDYETYLNDLDDIMDRKFELVAAVKDKIREELEE